MVLKPKIWGGRELKQGHYFEKELFRSYLLSSADYSVNAIQDTPVDHLKKQDFCFGIDSLFGGGLVYFISDTSLPLPFLDRKITNPYKRRTTEFKISINFQKMMSYLLYTALDNCMSQPPPSPVSIPGGNSMIRLPLFRSDISRSCLVTILSPTFL